MDIRIQKLNSNAVMPTKAFPTDAGFDLTATSVTYDEYGNIVCGFGLAFEIPEGYVGFVFPRSSVSKYDLSMANCIGVIDSHYRGEVTAKFKPMTIKPVRGAKGDYIEVYQSCSAAIYKVGNKCAQIIFVKLPDVTLVEAEELSKTDRGSGGYGHTGR